MSVWYLQCRSQIFGIKRHAKALVRDGRKASGAALFSLFPYPHLGRRQLAALIGFEFC